MNKEELNKIKQKALEEHIPIIMDDTLEVIAKYLTKIKPEKIQESLIKSVFNLNFAEKFEEISTRKQNQIDDFKRAWEIEVKQKGNNLWGAMSAMTRYTTHNMYKDAETSRKNKLFLNSSKKSVPSIPAPMPVTVKAFRIA